MTLEKNNPYYPCDWVRVYEVFKTLRDFIWNEHGVALPTKLILDYEGSYPNERDFAQTDLEAIYISPKVIGQPLHRLEGLFMHEFGHILLMSVNNYDHSETEADEAAYLCFGVPILYDREAVQSSLEGSPKRPDHIHQF